MKRVFPYYISVILLIMFTCCNKKNYLQSDTYSFKSGDGKPDYSDLHYWAAHPYKWDPSDSVPAPLRTFQQNDSGVDVFFIYPTSFTNQKDNRWNANIDDSLINVKTDYTSILYQASAFNYGTRVFAPRYRQAHVRAFYSEDTLNNILALNFAYSDIKEAFEYYLVNLNKGRPIIIASHSQGTLHAANLLKEFFDKKYLQQKLICAYLIGMPNPEHYFKKIFPCKDSLSTGCFAGWRTYKSNYNDTTYILKEKFKSWVTNPLSWKTDTIYMDKSYNKGGILKKFNTLKPYLVDAQVHGNILWCNKPKFFGSFLLKTSNYHIGDINLYYLNIRENVQTRIKMYYKGNNL